MGKKYTVSIIGNEITIFNTKNKFHRHHDITEFIFGQLGYNEETDKYPNYVHKDVWQQWENNKK